MKAGDRVAIVNSPPAYLAQLVPAPGDMHVEVKPDQSFDLVQLFVNNTDELRSLGANAIRGVKPDGLLWVCYPKGGKTRGVTDLPATPSWTKRDVLGEFTGEPGYQPVTLEVIRQQHVRWTAAEVDLRHPRAHRVDCERELPAQHLREVAHVGGHVVARRVEVIELQERALAPGHRRGKVSPPRPISFFDRLPPPFQRPRRDPAA